MKRPRQGSQRPTAAEIAARNAQIVVMREVQRMSWHQIGANFGVDEATARRGYDAHVEGRQHEVSFESAMREMREYVAVLQRSQAVLAEIAHELPDLDAKPGDQPRQYEARERIAAIHEQSELIFKEIALKQAIGDLPVDFTELVDHRDFEEIMRRVFALLKAHGVGREVFAEIEAIIESL